jgi:hypothetical protein
MASASEPKRRREDGEAGTSNPSRLCAGGYVPAMISLFDSRSDIESTAESTGESRLEIAKWE